MSTPARKSKGRQRIEMKKMSNESNLQVTFSKRRSGLFKKASELCTLCGAHVAIIVFSPGEKVFSFGHPNVDTVIDRYLTRGQQQNSGTLQFIEAHRSANVRELNGQLMLITNQLDAERKRGDELTRIGKTTAHFWWASPIEEMDKVRLEQLKAALEELKKAVTRMADRLLIQGAVANPSQLLGATLPAPVAVAAAAPVVAVPPPVQLFAQAQMIQPAMAAGMVHQSPMMQPQQGHMFDAGNVVRNHGFSNNIGGFGFF